jgi:multidrug efflux pump subunit AcrB/ABC-type multidrug transport system ATPase subunit
MNFIIKRKTLIAMVFIALTMLGYFSYKQLDVELYPNATLPMLFVQVASPLEVDPNYMESQVIIPLEGAIGTLEGVQKIQSTAGQQSGSIRVSFTKSTNIKYAYLKMVEKIDETKKKLPEEFQVQVYKFDLETLNNMLMSLQVRGSGGIDRVRQVVEKEVINKLKNIDGVANAEVFGGREKSIEIALDEDVCKSHGITPADVRSALSTNSRARVFAGKVTKNDQLHFVNIVAEFDDINDIYDLIIKSDGPVRLKDIADIRFGVKEQNSYSRINGMEAVTIQITRDAQANIIEVADAVKAQIKKLNAGLEQKDVVIVIKSNTAEIMETNIDLIIELALVGGVLAIFILWIFLRNIRLVTAIALAIPISIFTAFNFFYAAGVSLNSLTLLGMALAIGMLLDNSVVVLENIYRLAAKKMNPDQAVLQGTKEVWRSILAATLTTIMVFLPFVFSDDFFIGLLGKNIGVSIISTLLVSLIVALFLVPMVTHFFLKRKKEVNLVQFESIPHHSRFIQIYFVFLKTCMRNPGKTILAALGLFFVTLLLSLTLSMVSNSEAEVRDLTLYATLPGGTTLENTDLIIREAEQKLIPLEEREDVISQVYEGEAIITVKLIKEYKDKRNFSIPRIKNEIIEKLQDMRMAEFSWDPPASSGRFGNGGFDEEEDFGSMFGLGTQDEKIVIKGQDYGQMLNMANDIKYYVEQLASVRSINIRIPDKRPELQLNFDKRLMAAYDIQLNSILSELNSFQHEFSTGVTFKKNNEEYDIRIKTSGTRKQIERNVNDLKMLKIRGGQNSQFELQEVSGFNFTEGLSSINRTNQEKQLTLSYRFLDEIIDENDLYEAALLEIEETIEKVKLPSGMAIEMVDANDNLTEFRFLLFMAFVLIYMILASVFESFTIPIVMMFSIPMAAIGSLVLLILTGTSLMNANVLTGFLILLGIVVNNGIIMIDYARVLQKRGYRESRSLMMAGLARVRPILITAITTIIALIPLALGKAEYVTQIGGPFAITVIGGLSLSTILTLVFIPTLYSGLHSALKWGKNQSIYIKALQLIIFIVGGYLIYTRVDSWVWQIIDYLALLIGVPMSIYFIQNSLRQASEKLIGENDDLIIKIRNLVKIYDWDSRFVREWKSGINIRKRLGISNEYTSINDFRAILYLLPLIAFAIYFIYFHIESGLWYFILPIFLYLMIVATLTPFRKYAQFLKQNKKKKFVRIVFMFIFKLFFWVFPIFALYLFYAKYQLSGFIIPMGILWYLAIQIKVTSDKLYKDNININRIKGRFKGIRKAFYRLVKIIPLIGKKKIPFKAVKGVSFTIEKGMFGLLGPNGAGKSTLMRIVCGILEQSYGQITINGIDVSEKREELQGLIGYLPQEFGMYENMTASDFLHYMGTLKKLHDVEARTKRIEYVLKAVHMFDNRNEKIGSFSGGMKQRIGIAQILLHLPRILVVDEPTAGLDPRERIRFRNLLVELSKDRIVIFSTHIIEDVASSCNRVAVIKQGELKYLGAPIHMASKADGKVWMMNMPASEFETMKDKLNIVHHMRNGDQIRLRCIANEAPSTDAKPVKANLEDAYLCLLNENI